MSSHDNEERRDAVDDVRLSEVVTSSKPQVVLCMHSSSTPHAGEVQTAYETFCQCVDQHIMAAAVARLAVEEEGLDAIQKQLDGMESSEMHAAEQVRARVASAFAVLRKARRFLTALGMGEMDDNAMAEDAVPASSSH